MKSRIRSSLRAGWVSAVVIAWAFSTLRADQPGREKGTAAHREDEAALHQVGAEFIKAFEKGDAKAIARFWTDEGEYVAGDGTTLRGRAAIEGAYAKFFAENPQVHMQAKVESLRFLCRNAAVEEGEATVRRGDSALPTSARYSILYERDDGQWRMAIVREWPEEGATLADLDWLIGTWEAKSPLSEVRTTYEWDAEHHFIRVRFTIRGKERTVSGTEFIGRNPRSGQIHSWLFTSAGGFGEAAWSWDGKHWSQDATGVEADGGELSARNILTPIDRDSFTWQSVDRVGDGEPLPDVPPVKVRRVK